MMKSVQLKTIRLSRWFAGILAGILALWLFMPDGNKLRIAAEIEYSGPVIVAATPDTTCADPLEAEKTNFVSFSISVRPADDIAPGGRIRIEQGHIFDLRPLIGSDVRYTFPDPELTRTDAPNYCSVTAGTTPLETRAVPVGLGRSSLEAEFPKGLPEGRTATFCYGDTALGSPGLAVPAWPAKIRFITFIDPAGDGNYMLAEGPHPEIEVRAVDADRFEVTGPSVTHEASIRLKIVPVRGEPGLHSSSLPVRNFEGPFRIFLEEDEKECLAASDFLCDDPYKEVKIVLPSPGLYRLQAKSGDNKISGVSHPILYMGDRAACPLGSGHVEWEEGWKMINAFFAGSHLFWGSLQSHTAVGGHAASTPDEAFRFARDEAALDFCALTDHSSNPSFHWDELRGLPDAYNEPGRFCAFAGYEWTSARYGHRHIILKDGRNSVACSEEPVDDLCEQYAPDLDALAAQAGSDPNVLLIMHHTRRILDPAVKGYVFGNPEKLPRQRLFELFSWQGSSEGADDDLPINGREDRTYSRGSGFRDALDQGYIFGVTSDSDSHLGRPGLPVGIRRNNGIRYGFSGLTAVLSPLLNREALFHGLETLQCYGTTGARMILAFRIDEGKMGDVTQTVRDTVKVRAAIFATAPVTRVELISNNNSEVLEDQPGSLDLFIHKQVRLPETGGMVYFYLRIVQADGQMAWS
ncbi:MAG: DUF3604 domain-containing protein, partial [Planctomycetota bacterium]